MYNTTVLQTLRGNRYIIDVYITFQVELMDCHVSKLHAVLKTSFLFYLPGSKVSVNVSGLFYINMQKLGTCFSEVIS